MSYTRDNNHQRRRGIRRRARCDWLVPSVYQVLVLSRRRLSIRWNGCFCGTYYGIVDAHSHLKTADRCHTQVTTRQLYLFIDLLGTDAWNTYYILMFVPEGDLTNVFTDIPTLGRVLLPLLMSPPLDARPLLLSSIPNISTDGMHSITIVVRRFTVVLHILVVSSSFPRRCIRPKFSACHQHRQKVAVGDSVAYALPRTCVSVHLRAEERVWTCRYCDDSCICCYMRVRLSCIRKHV